MPQHQLFQKIFKSNLNADGAVELINEVKNDSPFFAVANYYLLKKTEQHSPAYENIASTTALHFASPFHLNQLLSATEDALYAVPGNLKAEDENSITEENPAAFAKTEEAVIEEPTADLISPEETVTDEQEASFLQQEEKITAEPHAVIVENEITVNEQDAQNSNGENSYETKNEALENVEAKAAVSQEVLPIPAPEENTTPKENNNQPEAKVENA
ncbi:MAG: hypothetical protein ABI091_14380, partial [Ferruginibacter sp.]